MLDRDAHSGGRHSLRKIPDKNIFVPCPCTFRLRRLARNARRKFGLLLLCGLYMCKFPRTIALVTCTLHFNFAGSHTMGSKALRGNTFCKLPASVVPTICPGKNFDRAGLQKTCRLVSRSWGATFFLQISSLIPVTCRPRKLAQSVGPTPRARHFLHQFPSRMLVVTCPCAFRLRGLAQNVRLTSRRHLLTRTCK